MYAEIRNNYVFGPAVSGRAGAARDDDLFAGASIDAWKTDDDDEVGETVAQVLMTRHGDIITAWHDGGAKLSPGVMEAISCAKEDLAGLWNEKHGADCPVRFLRPSDGHGSLPLMRVMNWDRDFGLRLMEAFGQCDYDGAGPSQVIFSLMAGGYDIDVLDADGVPLTAAAGSGRKETS